MKAVWKVQATLFAQFCEPLLVIPAIKIGVSRGGQQIASSFFRRESLLGNVRRQQDPSQIVCRIEPSHNEVGKFLKAADGVWIRHEFIENPEFLACLACVDITKMIDS